jgi:hypothetical protein
MKTYDLLVILDLAGKEESLPEALAGDPHAKDGSQKV